MLKKYITWYIVVEEFLSVSLIYHEIWLISLLLCVPEAVQFCTPLFLNNDFKKFYFFHNFRPFFHTSNLCANHRAYSRRLQSWCTSTTTSATSKRPEWWMAFETPFADAEVLRVVSKNSPKSIRNLIANKSTNGSSALNGVRNQETAFGKWFCFTHNDLKQIQLTWCTIICDDRKKCFQISTLWSCCTFEFAELLGKLISGRNGRSNYSSFLAMPEGLKMFHNTKKVITWPLENESRNIDEVTSVFSSFFLTTLISAFTIALSASEDDISLSTKRRGQKNSLSSPQSVTFDRKFNHREKKSTYITSKVFPLLTVRKKRPFYFHLNNISSKYCM